MKIKVLDIDKRKRYINIICNSYLEIYFLRVLLAQLINNVT